MSQRQRRLAEYRALTVLISESLEKAADAVNRTSYERATACALIAQVQQAERANLVRESGGGFGWDS